MDVYAIAGGWLGTYYFDDATEPCRFEATFNAPNSEGQFLGRILDDNELGEANVEGVQAALTVSFVKVYIRPPQETVPITYRGDLSEDGTRITGIWRLEWQTHGHIIHRTGTWEARRLWYEAVADEVHSESEGLLIGAR